jgi:hypothetical protein
MVMDRPSSTVVLVVVERLHNDLPLCVIFDQRQIVGPCRAKTVVCYFDNCYVASDVNHRDIELQCGVFWFRFFRLDGPSAAKGLLASIMSVEKLALSRMGSALESLASISIHSGLTVPGSCRAVRPAAVACWA